MALRKLDKEEQEFLSKICQEIGAIGKTVTEEEIEAYSYEWNQLSTKMQEVLRFFNSLKRVHNDGKDKSI